MDLIEKLRRINGLVYIVDDMPDYDHEIAHVAADEIERLREALQKIADIEHEDLAAPKSAAEAVLWVCLDRCVALAEDALKEKDNED